ncbi:hypothetical protein [Klebsiella pneumoniae]|uniref:hypothetical protein n=1 Tax=Klebsiella pneumoniae TaxID=573 RepID=UPI00142B65CF|nr:hypothetical protein [Klebsiella pneumoniae]MCO0867342.1 hypothetical protein [Klebsiella pneumoniae]MZY52965.1 hypothetical protein [Klebsiella pneumoniae]
MFKNGFFGPMNAKTQEGMGMSDLPKNIQVIFDNNPMLKELRKVRISTLRNENETFSQLNSITYIGVFLRLVTYSHLP